MIRILSLMALLFAAPSLADTVRIETSQGVVEAPAAPEKVAVFDLAAFDSLAALGVQPVGLVRPVFLSYLEEAAAGTEAVGSLFEPDFEALFALQPDLIIAGGRSSEQVPELARIAPTLDMTISQNTIGDGLARLAAYGKLFGKEGAAAALTAEFEAKLAATRQALAGKGTALIVMTNGPKISAYGAAGRFGWLHEALGLPEAVDGVQMTNHGEAISFEFIREANPDILLVIDRMAAIGQQSQGARATLDNALVHETTAWKTGHIVHLSAAPIYIAGGGIQSMTLTLDEINAALVGG
ncbi:siderophore ABC transporter substrate-binding protein [Aliishimia ponticola]|uniref:Siderophore ABC transporter substrate-binding protein n=1 Tax=Aliishimia ponticola TaxID=2499833 RepID=A0A4S4NBB0_9RHOB|nr:siderophore ABC transporter substrate-binding protein [Aliishimia ponticola]THH36684.1 siderophore ABC transporter substrate-binding protein [Aliishimia ponticola]